MAIDLNQIQHPLGLRRLGYSTPLLEVAARRWVGGRPEEGTEQVAEETPVAIVYNGIPHVVMMATPADLKDFALGFSVTEELIRSPADLTSLEVVRYGQGIEIQATVSPECEATIASRNRRLTGRTGCGICGVDSIEGVLKQLHPVGSSATVTTAAVENACRTLVGHQTLNSAAGAIHAAGWASLDGDVQLAREDVGRHNALDKLIGAHARGRRGCAGGIHRGDQPGQLRDGTEGDRRRRPAAGGDLGTHRPRRADRRARRAHPRGLRAGWTPHGLHPWGARHELTRAHERLHPLRLRHRSRGSARTASRTGP